MARRFSIGCALVIASAFGCNSIAGIHDPLDQSTESAGTEPPPGPEDAGDAGAPTDAARTGDNIDRFVGTWKTPGAVQTVSCPGGTGQIDPKPQFTIVIERGAASGTIETFNQLAPQCRLVATVVGDRATLRPNQTCTLTFADGERDTYTYTGNPSTFTIRPTDNTTADELLNATLFVAPPNQASYTCIFVEQSVYTKQL